MRIKEIELAGFKSFLDKTKFEFNVPITTIVGPNGCGKSNVVDAIKWITGELSFKELRGKTMEDLIFAGSDRRPPTSMMEVTLTLDNHQKRAPAQYNEYNELTVQRRIFRDGSSEFFLNKVPCRLRDITDLFLDTGIGESSYSIIEQGRVGAIVSGRSEDRRLMIEEAAGITKYKHRKKAAERKIEYTKQNLLRVSDIILELKKQIASLERQAKKAEEYRKAQTKAQEVDVALSAKEYSDLKSASKESLEKETYNSDLLSQEESKLSQDQSIYETKRLELDEFEKIFQSSQQDLFATKSSIQQLTNQIETHQRDLTRLSENIANEKIKDEVLTAEISKTQQKIEETRQQIELLESENNNLRNGLTEKQKTCAEQKSVLTTIETEIETQKSSHIDVVTREAKLDSVISSNQSLLANLRHEIGQLQESETALLSEIETKKKLYTEQKETLDKANQLSFSFEENQKSTKSRLEELEIKKTELDTEITAIQSKLNANASRLHALQEFTRTYQGYKKSVQSVMKNRESLGHVQGVLGEMIKPKKGFEKAIQAALSELIECVIVDGAEDATKVSEFLKNTEKNRGLFLASNTQINITQPPIKNNLVLGPLQNYIEIQSPNKDAIRNIFSRTYVIQGQVEELLELWKSNPYYSFVTLEGDYISETGVIHAGPWSETPGDLQVRQQIEELKVEIEPLKATRDDWLVQLNQYVKNINQTKHELQTIYMDLERQSKINLDLSRESEKHFHSIEFLQQKLTETQSRIQKLQLSITTTAALLEQSEGEKVEITAKKLDLGQKISELNLQIDESRSNYQRYVDELNEYQVKIASSFERAEGLRRSYEAAVERLGYNQAEKEQNASLIQKHTQEMEEINSGLQIVRTEKDSRIEDFQQQEVSNSELQSRHDVAVNEIREIESKIKQSHSQKEMLMSTLSEVRMKITEFALRMENIQRQAQEKYNVDLLSLLATPEYAIVTDEVYSEMKQEMEVLKDKIIKFGNVNLAAIEEVDQLRERFDFLTNQKDDLEKSLQTLTEAIRKINRTTREKFETTYNQVNERFQQIFPRLFRGGKAKLMLTDPENILETGVDIFAQPPGKKLQNMNLLSGGEKALTAISLLFAIFEFKAPPFCVLDEVDAPLDDANVLRFVSIVKEMSQKTQFIVITHNKNTMEMANNLYGVTMEEPGLSRVVSVRLHQDTVAEVPEPVLETRSVA